MKPLTPAQPGKPVAPSQAMANVRTFGRLHTGVHNATSVHSRLQFGKVL